MNKKTRRPHNALKQIISTLPSKYKTPSSNVPCNVNNGVYAEPT